MGGVPVTGVVTPGASATGMPDTTSCTTLLLRLRPADDQAPEVYPVEVTLDGAGTFSARVSLEPGAFKNLESSPWEYGHKLGQAVFTDPGLQRALAYNIGSAYQGNARDSLSG